VRELEKERARPGAEEEHRLAVEAPGLAVRSVEADLVA